MSISCWVESRRIWVVTCWWEICSVKYVHWLITKLGKIMFNSYYHHPNLAIADIFLSLFRQQTTTRPKSKSWRAPFRHKCLETWLIHFTHSLRFIDYNSPSPAGNKTFKQSACVRPLEQKVQTLPAVSVRGTCRLIRWIRTTREAWVMLSTGISDWTWWHQVCRRMGSHHTREALGTVFSNWRICVQERYGCAGTIKPQALKWLIV